MLLLPELLKMNSGVPVADEAGMRIRRLELLDILQKNAYGIIPEKTPVTGKLVNDTEKCCSGDAHELTYEISCIFGENAFAFPFKLFLPNGKQNVPLIIVINFRPSPYDEYIPVEEIIDNGFALGHIYYGDITEDNGDFSNKLAAYFPRTESGSDPGKISIWAWAISRALDYTLTLNLPINKDKIGVIGHSRLGKTALWCGANDERFTYVCSNDSGCMGAAYARSYHKGGEPVSSIAKVFPYWFCKNFQNYKDDVDTMPFDQHYLLAAIAPRRLLVNSASRDYWADPASEQNSCIAASPAWLLYKRKGYCGETQTYTENDGCLTGDIGYYKRSGVHFLGRKDWLHFIQFMKDNQDC